MTKKLFNGVASVAIAGAILLSAPVVEEVTGASIVSIRADAATISYTQTDLNRLISTHDKFIDKFGRSAYLYYISSNKTMMNYVKEVQHSMNFLAEYCGVNDSTDVDGYYGPDCKKLVKTIQGKLNCTKDGYFGNGSYAATVAKLREILESSSINSSVNAVANAAEIFVHQSPNHCTAAAASMLLKNYCRINNTSDWRSISEETIRTGNASPSDTWNCGLKLGICFNRPGASYNGLKMKAYTLTGSAAEKKSKIQKLLINNPSGVVLYGTNGGCHAVYMASNGKILDPWYNDGGKYRELSQSANSCSDSYGDITQYWVIEI